MDDKSFNIDDKRQVDYERFWRHINPSMEGYGDMIDNLLSFLTDRQLAALVNRMDPGK